MESLELPASQTGPVVTISLLNYPEPADLFPCEWRKRPACIFVVSNWFASAGEWGPGAVNREEGLRESKKWLHIPWKRGDISTHRGRRTHWAYGWKRPLLLRLHRRWYFRLTHKYLCHSFTFFFEDGSVLGKNRHRFPVCLTSRVRLFLRKKASWWERLLEIHC